MKTCRFEQVGNCFGTKTSRTFNIAAGINKFHIFLMFLNIFLLFIKCCGIHSFCARKRKDFCFLAV